jgi:hypothetical protein
LIGRTKSPVKLAGTGQFEFIAIGSDQFLGSNEVFSRETSILAKYVELEESLFKANFPQFAAAFSLRGRVFGRRRRVRLTLNHPANGFKLSGRRAARRM